jgi:DoxX-like protein
MTDATRATVPLSESKRRRWPALVLTGIPVLFLIVDGGMKVALSQPVIDAMPALGYPVALARPIGVILLACLAVYLYPRTAILGAILLTGFLGGAVATNVRVGNPLFSHVLFPVYVATMLWGGLYLRDARLRALVPLRAGRSDAE